MSSSEESPKEKTDEQASNLAVPEFQIPAESEPVDVDGYHFGLESQLPSANYDYSSLPQAGPTISVTAASSPTTRGKGPPPISISAAPSVSANAIGAPAQAPSRTSTAPPPSTPAAENSEQGKGPPISPFPTANLNIGKFQPELTPDAIKSYLREYWRTTLSVCLAPTVFFQQMQTEGGGYHEPLKYFGVSTLGYVLLLFVFSWNLFGALFEGVFTVLFILFLSRAIVYLLQQFGGKGTLEGTFRVMAYSSAPLIIMGLPIVSPLGLIYMAVLWFIGLKKVHQMGP